MLNFYNIGSSIGSVLSGGKEPHPNQELIDSIHQSKLVVSQTAPLPQELKEQLGSIVDQFIPWMLENFERLARNGGEERARFLYSRMATMQQLAPQLNASFRDESLWNDSVVTSAQKITSQAKQGRSYRMVVGELAYSAERLAEKRATTRNGFITFLEIVRDVVPEDHSLNLAAQSVLAQLREQPAEAQKQGPSAKHGTLGL